LWLRLRLGRRLWLRLRLRLRFRLWLQSRRGTRPVGLDGKHRPKLDQLFGVPGSERIQYQSIEALRDRFVVVEHSGLPAAQ
jgi:hypothetical protein